MSLSPSGNPMADTKETMESNPQLDNSNSRDGTPMDRTTAGFLSTSLFEQRNDTNPAKLSLVAMENDDHMQLEANAKWIESVSGKQYSISQRHRLLQDVVVVFHGHFCYLNGHNWDSRP